MPNIVLHFPMVVALATLPDGSNQVHFTIRQVAGVGRVENAPSGEEIVVVLLRHGEILDQREGCGVGIKQLLGCDGVDVAQVQVEAAEAESFAAEC